MYNMNIIDAVRSWIDISDEIGGYIELKFENYGKYDEYIVGLGYCPLKCSEKGYRSFTRNFRVIVQEQRFFCDDCSSAGDVITFVSSIREETEIETILFLCDKYDLNVIDLLLAYKKSKDKYDLNVQRLEEKYREIINKEEGTDGINKKIDDTIQKLEHLRKLKNMIGI